MELTNAHLRYLLTIYELGKTTLDVGAAEVAKAMGVSKPSVTRMLGVFMERGYLVRERYGKIYLTDTGVLLARKYSKKVEFLCGRIPALRLSLTDEETMAIACLLATELPETAYQT